MVCLANRRPVAYFRYGKRGDWTNYLMVRMYYVPGPERGWGESPLAQKVQGPRASYLEEDQLQRRRESIGTQYTSLNRGSIDSLLNFPPLYKYTYYENRYSIAMRMVQAGHAFRES